VGEERDDTAADLVQNLGAAFAGTPLDEDFDAAAELRALGLDADALGTRLARVAMAEKRKLILQLARERIEGWVDELLNQVGEWLLPLDPAALLRGGERVERDTGDAVSDPLLEEAVALLSNGAYSAARENLDRLLAARGERDWQLRWIRMHALVGEGNLESARIELERIIKHLDNPQAAEILQFLRQLTDSPQG
jgi:tetratricopeptide (TPR) repeat protein